MLFIFLLGCQNTEAPKNIEPSKKEISFAKTDAFSEEKNQYLNRFSEAVAKEDKEELSKWISYPLKRKNPLPNIHNEKEFINYYSIIFDDSLKNKIIKTSFNASNSIDNYRGLGILNGAIWFDSEGKVMTINYQSQKETEKLNVIREKIKQEIHPSLKHFKENVLVCQSEKFLIRIDLMDDYSYRYSSWSLPKKINEEPDLILEKGTSEFLGTMGGIIYSFKNHSWTYNIEKINIAEKDEDTGLFLRLYKNDKMEVNQRCKEIK